MKIYIRNLNLWSVAWIAIGVIIFLLGWCWWYYAMPLTVLICSTIYLGYKHDTDATMEISHRKFWAAFAICFVMMALCGIGGYVVQSNDNYWRNAMFRDLVNYSWPVYDVTTNLTKSYYIGFWMLPSLLAKVIHSMEVGFFSQLLWLSIGMQLLFLQICRYMGKARLSYLFFFYFFSGLKIVELLFFYPVSDYGSFATAFFDTVATNGTPGAFHAPPIVQLLYDPFNQTVPLFLGMMVMINQKKNQLLPLLFVLLVLYAPLPLVGLAPLVLYWWGKNIAAAPARVRWKEIINVENVTAMLTLIVLALYIFSNNNSGHKGLRAFDVIGTTVYAYILYIVFEFALLMAIGYKACKDKIALWIAFISVCLFGWFQLGLHNDFCFRTNMPLIFMLFLLVTKRYYMAETCRWLRYAILAWCVVAGVPTQIHPCMRWLSSMMIITGHPQAELNNYQHIKDVTTLYVMQQTKLRNDDLPSSFRCRPDWYQFRTDVGSPDSFFFKYIAK